MWKQMKIESPELTRPLLKWFRSLQSLIGDRDQNSWQGRKRKAWHRDLLRQGRFHSPEWAVARLNGELWRVNGGHTSGMLAELSEMEFPKNLRVIVKWFECETHNDLLTLFNEFDSRKSMRTAADKIKAHRQVHPGLEKVPPSVISRIIGGVVCYRNNGSSVKIDEDDRTAFLHHETDFIQWCAPFARKRHMAVVGVLACMYRSWWAHSEKAMAFWEAVRDKTAPTPSDPTRVLAEWLTNNTAPSVKRPSMREFYVRCIHAWNASEKGMSTRLSYVQGAPVPKMWVKGNNNKFHSVD